MTKPARDAVLATSGVKKATPSLEITKQAVASSKLVGPSLPSGSSNNSPRIIGPSMPSVASSPASASSPLIGPRLPPQQKNKPALISEPVKSKQPSANSHQSTTPTITAVKPTASTKLLASPLVKPKVPVVEQKAKPPQQVGAGGLVPYGSDSDDSDEADSSKPSTKPIVNGIKPAGSPQIGAK